MARQKRIRTPYEGPVPVTPVPMPHLEPTNPVSWLHVLYAWSRVRRATVAAAACVYHRPSNTFRVLDPADMAMLWRRGYYGKGSLSRLEPSWAARTLRRLGLAAPAELASEEVTAMRRQERTRFKQERERVEQLELQARLEGLDARQLAPEKDRLHLLRHLRVEYAPGPHQPAPLRPEDLQVVDVSTATLAPLEYLQLTPLEAVFLLVLGCLQVVCDDGLAPPAGADAAWWLMHQVLLDGSTPLPHAPRLVEYVVYHHYRSLGWCVRLGVKFGVDMLLYDRGPPFAHAEHAVVVVPPGTDPRTWTWAAGAARVVGNVRKNLVLVYVTPPLADAWSRFWHTQHSNPLLALLALYRLLEVGYRRWVPARSRE